MNGMVKSTAVLRWYVIVKSQIAKSAFCGRQKNDKINKFG